MLDDVRSFEYMLENDWFENDITRIGAEQEMVMVNLNNYKPACVAIEALEKLKDYEWVGTELAKFNLETNLTPREFTTSCFHDLHTENSDKLNIIQDVLKEMGFSLVLTGILPTLRKYHLTMDNLTPKQRYYALMAAIHNQLQGANFELRLDGLDELYLKHDSPLLEAVNTSFQVHLQVASHDFVHKYNIAQALTAPIMAIGANSPVVLASDCGTNPGSPCFNRPLIRDHPMNTCENAVQGLHLVSHGSKKVSLKSIRKILAALGSC